MNMNMNMTRPRLIKIVPASSSSSSSASSSLRKREPLLPRSRSLPSPRAVGFCGGSTLAEVCGETTAECAAVACCCPCGIVNLVVLAVYKVPAKICRRALRHRRRRSLTKQGLVLEKEGGTWCYEGESIKGDVAIDDWLEVKGEESSSDESEEDEAAVAALEAEMWGRFYGAGFWRSPSQNETLASRLN